MKETFNHYDRVSKILKLSGMTISKEKFEKMQKAQFDKGFAKYGMTLQEQESDSYNWTEMAVEELIDFCNYVEKNKLNLK